MYTQHFGLKNKPFNAVPDPRFLWLNEEQRRKMAYLRHALISQDGFVLITGDVGMGKTTLAKGLAKSVAKAASAIYVPDPDMGKLDFFNFIADGLGLERYFESKADFLIHLKRRLRRADANFRKVVLVIDEAHRFNHETLQEIRLLSNIETGGRMQLSTLLIGLPEIEDILRVEENRNVMQRITSSIHLTPLSAECTRRYIIYRLRKAGAARGIFTGTAIEQIHSHSGGNPRLINLLCDHALVTGYAADRKTIDSKIVQECVGELDISFFERTTGSGAPKTDPEDFPGVYEAACRAHS